MLAHLDILAPRLASCTTQLRLNVNTRRWAAPSEALSTMMNLPLRSLPREMLLSKMLKLQRPPKASNSAKKISTSPPQMLHLPGRQHPECYPLIRLSISLAWQIYLAGRIHRPGCGCMLGICSKLGTHRMSLMGSQTCRHWTMLCSNWYDDTSHHTGMYPGKYTLAWTMVCSKWYNNNSPYSSKYPSSWKTYGPNNSDSNGPEKWDGCNRHDAPKG